MAWSSRYTRRTSWANYLQRKEEMFISASSGLVCYQVFLKSFYLMSYLIYIPFEKIYFENYKILVLHITDKTKEKHHKQLYSDIYKSFYELLKKSCLLIQGPDSQVFTYFSGVSFLKLQQKEICFIKNAFTISLALYHLKTYFYYQIF